MRQKINKKYRIFSLLILVGIFLRFAAMAVGYNFDFESYSIVGEIAGHFRNVYAETFRYNYGPVFFCILGLLYRIARLMTDNWELIYRVLMVLTLTLGDLGITLFIAKRYSLKLASIFFLNPLSIIITGYHNQFDNIAVFLALLTILFYNEEEQFNKKDVGFVGLLTLCLMTKHILFMIPFFLLLKKGLPIKKKIVYTCVPPLLFLLSFVPFALSSSAAFEGILHNVFLYRSWNNAPLFSLLYKMIGFPSEPRIYVYVLIMIVIAIITRTYSYEKQILVYFVSMVAFSSAIANQYLVIPMAALCILDVGAFRYVYMCFSGIYLILEQYGFGMAAKIPGIIGKLADIYVYYGYMIIAWILFFTLLYVLCFKRRIVEK